MNSKLLEKINIIYRATLFPCYVYSKKDNKLVCPIPSNHIITAPPMSVRQELLLSNSYIYFDKSHLCYGYIDILDSEYHIIVGPMSPTGYPHDLLHQLHLEYIVLPEDRETFNELIRNTPTMPYNHFVEILDLIYMALNNQTMSYSKELFNSIDLNAQGKTPAATSRDSFYSTGINDLVNNSHEVMDILLNIVTSGDLPRLKQFFESPPHYSAGPIANTNSRLYKNYFIVSLAVVGQKAVECGISSDLINPITDSYISLVETVSSIDKINQLYVDSFTQITTLIKEEHEKQSGLLYQDNDELIMSVINYIRQNVNQPITVQNVADRLGYNRYYLSDCFSRRLGFHLNTYIYRCKIEEAKWLLLYTDKSISDISSFLYFSSQSHFQKRFKEMTGITPNAYRKGVRRSGSSAG